MIAKDFCCNRSCPSGPKSTKMFVVCALYLIFCHNFNLLCGGLCHVTAILDNNCILKIKLHGLLFKIAMHTQNSMHTVPLKNATKTNSLIALMCMHVERKDNYLHHTWVLFFHILVVLEY